jgi:hypothetical protein
VLITALLRLTLLQQSEEGQPTPEVAAIGKELKACSLFAWLISHQPVTTNQPPATSQQYFSLRTNQHQPSATSQTNRLMV